MKIMKIIWIMLATLARNLVAGSMTGLANTAESAMSLVGLANKFESGEEWVQVAPYGDFPHSRGIQRVDRKAADAMVNHFSRLSSKLARRFGGLPFYIGHPDHPDHAKEFPDQRAYGWVNSLETREDGIYAKVEWSAPGKELLTNSHFKFLSPHWNADTSIEGGKKVLRPVELVSIGLTNKPNLPVNPLANEAENTTICMKELIIKLFGLANEATDEDIKTRLTAAAAAMTALANAQSELTTAKTSLSNEQGQRTTFENQFKAERRERCVLLVNEAIREGRVAPEKKDEWVTKLEKDFEAGKTALANEVRSGRAIKTEARTREQGGRRSGFANISDAREQFDALVNEKVRAGIDFDTAYNTVKKQKPELYKSMSTPERSED
jgi:phage I-like protein